MASLKSKLQRFSDFLQGKSMLSRSSSWGSSRRSSFWSKHGSFESRRQTSDLDSDYEENWPCFEISEMPCVAMYVGEQRQRFVVPIAVLSHSLMRRLLDRSAEEYGFEYSGGLTIPCNPVLFEHFLWLLEKNQKQAAQLAIDELFSITLTRRPPITLCTESAPNSG